MITVLLDKTNHDRKRFDCGVETLNNYLKVMANQQAQKDNTRTYILEDPQNESRIIGVYTLTMAQADLEKLPQNLQKKHQTFHNHRRPESHPVIHGAVRSTLVYVS